MDKIMHNYMCLAYAVAVTAIEDYRKVKSRLREDSYDEEFRLKRLEIEEYFAGDSFSTVCDFNEDIRKAVMKEMAEDD